VFGSHAREVKSGRNLIKHPSNTPLQSEKRGIKGKKTERYRLETYPRLMGDPPENPSEATRAFPSVLEVDRCRKPPLWILTTHPPPTE